MTGPILNLCLTYSGQFNKRKSALNRRLLAAVMNPAFRMAKFDCDEVHKVNGKYLHCLRKCEILPYENSFNEHSFSTIAERASRLESCNFTSCNRRRCDCYEIVNMDLKMELQKVIEECWNMEPGFCIQCIKGKSLKGGSGKHLHTV
jgi:hypothetical protein